MHARTRRFGWVTSVVTAYNIEKIWEYTIGWIVTDRYSSFGLWRTLDAFLTNKYTFAAATGFTCICIADWLVRRSMRLEREPGRRGALAIGLKRFMLHNALAHPRLFGWMIDVRHELTTLNVALMLPHMSMPPLPTTDPDDAAGMQAVQDYLMVMGSVRARHLDAARRRVSAMTVASSPPAVVTVRPSRWREALMALIEPR